MKNFRHADLFVNFLSGPPHDAHYSIYDRATNQTSRIATTPQGIRGIGRDATQSEIDAINAYLAAEAAEFAQWVAQNPELAKYA